MLPNFISIQAELRYGIKFIDPVNCNLDYKQYFRVKITLFSSAKHDDDGREEQDLGFPLK